MSSKKPNLFLRILSESWEKFKQKYPTYSTEYYNDIIKKVQSCGDPAFGFIKYQCLYCGEDEKVIGFTCKNSFCLRCGTTKAMNFVEEVTAKLYSGVKYSHLVFTIPEQFRAIFYKNRQNNELFNLFFQTAWDCLQNLMKAVSHNDAINPGCIMVIHLTGRKSSYNPHIHMIVAMGGIDGISGRWIDVKTIPFNLMRFRWKKYLLEMMEKFDDSIEMQKLIKFIKKKFDKGLVVYLDLKKMPKDGKGLTNYLAKYLFRPSISVKRIIAYDKDDDFVEYEYADHESGKIQREKVDVCTFVGRMVQQILPKGFKRVRYLGLHGTAVAQKSKEAVVKGLAKKFDSKIPNKPIIVNRAKKLSFREKIIYWKNKDPLKCKKCGTLMELVQVWIKEKGFVFDLFEEMANGPPSFENFIKNEKKLAPKEEPAIVQMSFLF